MTFNNDTMSALFWVFAIPTVMTLLNFAFVMIIVFGG